MKALIQLKGVKTYFPHEKTAFGKTISWVKAVDNVTLDIMRGECLGLVGETGCGKSTLGRAILRLAPLTAGSIIFDGVDIGHLKFKGLQCFRPRMQMVFQEPRSSLNPRMKVADILKEALNICLNVDKTEHFERATQLLDMVDMRPEFLFRYPHEFSGGQQQRICIARALATQPDFIVFDEATTAVDVSVQAQIINLMAALRKKLKLTYLFISHDLSIMEQVCDRVAVMYAGDIVEVRDAKSLFVTPMHPYSKALKDALPIADPARRHELGILQGEVPKLTDPPTGCRFHPRCQYATEICSEEIPSISIPSEGNWVRCHHYKELWEKRVLH
jgi:oligopeptide/dipeptide ABC transporter ATP-binding protein